MTKLLAVIAVLVLSAAGAVTAIARDGNENPTRARADTATTKVAIVHVRNGCHVWSNGSRNGVAMRLRVKRGANLQITNRDVVPHQLVQLAGPKLRLEGHMMTGKTQLVSFKQRGAYLMFTGGAAVLLPDGVFLPRPSELPDLPWGLVGLTGVSAGTYLLNKSVTTNGLSVDGLATTTVARGQTARILGRNVLPDGSAALPKSGVAVMLGGRRSTCRASATARSCSRSPTICRRPPTTSW